MGKEKRAQQNRTGQAQASRRNPVSSAPATSNAPSRSSRRAIWIVAAALLVVVAAAGAYVLVRGVPPGSGVAVPAGPPLNILLVTLDTTRADHLGCYGWGRARTPELDRLAREGVRFERAFSPVPVTLPAHASLMTGRYPFAHGVRNNGNFYLADKFETLATVLKGRGYRTAAFVSSFVLDRRYGLQRGFETYDDRMDAAGDNNSILNLQAERRGDHAGAALDAWLTAYARQASAPFFAWLHLYDPHEPYAPPPPFREEFAGALYDGEIAFDDALVGKVVERLGALGLLERTLIAVIGDHGESLGDHGEETHTMFVYDSAIRVPWILWRPGRVPAGLVVREPVRLTDLAPTLLDLVGAPGLATPHGRSVRPLLEGRAPGAALPIYAETLMPELYLNWAPLRAVREERWKYIEAPKPELYDLATDPGERTNVYDARPQTVRGLQQALERLTGGAAGALNVGTLDRETLEKLAALGYVGAGAAPQAAAAGAVRADPKDMIGIYNRLRHANAALTDRRFADAQAILGEVLAKDSHNAFARFVLGGACMGMNDYRGAIVQYRKYLELVPASANAHALIATCYQRLEDRQNAVREADAALAIDPRFSDARILKAGVMAAQGNTTGALAELRATVASDPEKPRLHFELAKALEQAGQGPAAEAEFQAALRLQADYAPALAGLGTLYAREGKHAQAVQALERALAVAPQQEQARFNLAGASQQLGRVAEARAEYQRLVDAPATSPAVRAAARTRLAGLAER